MLNACVLVRGRICLVCLFLCGGRGFGRFGVAVLFVRLSLCLGCWFALVEWCSLRNFGVLHGVGVVRGLFVVDAGGVFCCCVVSCGTMWFWPVFVFVVVAFSGG